MNSIAEMLDAPLQGYARAIETGTAINADLLKAVWMMAVWQLGGSELSWFRFCEINPRTMKFKNYYFLMIVWEKREGSCALILFSAI